MDTRALFNVSYGLYVLTTNYDGIDNGCIINTLQQVTSEPCRLSIVVNKKNHTHDLIIDSCVFNVNVLTKETPFSVFQHFGFQSGKNVRKFDPLTQHNRSANNVIYLQNHINSYFSCRTVKTIDLGTHTMFIADIIDAQRVSDVESVTYDYYQKHIKPQKTVSKGCWVCNVCGYVYEGDTLPEGFICPICKHGRDSFEKK